ncbi:hypothetical protein D3C84_878640 [compost metagenome]
MANPLIKVILKQLEDNAVVIEKQVKPIVNYHSTDGMLITKTGVMKDADAITNTAFDQLHHSIGVIKTIVLELF